MKKSVSAILLVLYLYVWGLQKSKDEWSDYYLAPAAPASVLRIASGYAQQMVAFSLFVKVAVFTGGSLRGVEKMSYADNLAQNFDVMTKLYPEFIDSYHYCQSYLATISPEYAQKANNIHERAVISHPESLYFPFFQAFNYFYYLDEPLKAAELFLSMSKNPDAPQWFGHFAGKLMARGGNLQASQTLLQTIINTEQNEYAKKRYQRSLDNVNKALQVQVALDRYRDDHNGKDVISLQDLIPRYLIAIPRFNDNYVLSWHPPVLRLEQPIAPSKK